MSVAQVKAARRKNKQRYRKPKGRSVAESIERNRKIAERMKKARG